MALFRRKRCHTPITLTRRLMGSKTKTSVAWPSVVISSHIMESSYVSCYQPQSNSTQECIFPSGIVAPLSNLAVLSCSVVILAPVRSARRRSAPSRLASRRSASLRSTLYSEVSFRVAARSLDLYRSASCRSALLRSATHYSRTFLTQQ